MNARWDAELFFTKLDISNDVLVGFIAIYSNNYGDKIINFK